MSTTKAVTIWCDWFECHRWIDQGNPSTTTTRTEAQVRYGWGWPWEYADDGSRQRVDLCPEHYTEWRQGAAVAPGGKPA